MGGIIERILAQKRMEVAQRRELFPVKLLERSVCFTSPTVSLRKYLERADRFGIIAEIKRRSPSRGLFKQSLSVEEISIGYMQAGASGLSVLTDGEFFGGSNDDLVTARKFNFCPILRKDFIIDEYQLVEARSIGADIVLLIARCLDFARQAQLAKFASSLGLQVLLEVHDQSELEGADLSHVDLVGVNNRDLDTLEVNLETSFRLAELIPDEIPKICESGLTDAQVIHRLSRCGFKGFLIGEAFMSAADPAKACNRLIRELQGMPL